MHGSIIMKIMNAKTDAEKTKIINSLTDEEIVQLAREMKKPHNINSDLSVMNISRSGAGTRSTLAPRVAGTNRELTDEELIEITANAANRKRGIL